MKHWEYKEQRLLAATTAILRILRGMGLKTEGNEALRLVDVIYNNKHNTTG